MIEFSIIYPLCWDFKMCLHRNEVQIEVQINVQQFEESYLAKASEKFILKAF